ncbi:1818_t:CDS:2, partial [Cetraspora pellucida]
VCGVGCCWWLTGKLWCGWGAVGGGFPNFLSPNGCFGGPPIGGIPPTPGSALAPGVVDPGDWAVFELT